MKLAILLDVHNKIHSVIVVENLKEAEINALLQQYKIGPNFHFKVEEVESRLHEAIDFIMGRKSYIKTYDMNRLVEKMLSLEEDINRLHSNMEAVKAEFQDLTK